MTNAAIAADFLEALDIHSDLSAKITFNGVILFDDITDTVDFFVGEVLDAGVRIDIGLLKNLAGTRASDTVNVGQSDFNTLISRQINTRNTSHLMLPP